MSVTLSTDQERARQLVVAALAGRSGPPVVLTGPAGTGKTTLARSLADDLRASGRQVSFVAPTGRAAKVLTTKLDGDDVATTIHRALYRRVEEDEDGEPDFTSPQPPCSRGAVLIVDEGSMVGTDIATTLMEQCSNVSARILVLGDKAQIPPVNDEWGFDLGHPTAELVEIHRQALESPIIRAATMVRTGEKLPRWTVDGYHRERANQASVRDWIARRVTAGADHACLVGTNTRRQALNRSVRSALGHDGPIVVGDRLLVLSNNYEIDLMNGEIVTVAAVEPTAMKKWPDADDFRDVVTTEGHRFPVCLPLMGARYGDWRRRIGKREFGEEVVHVDYGYAMTVHKAQGSEWEQVCLVLDGGMRWWCKKDPPMGRRLIYTAVTRAANHLRVVDLGGR